MNIEKFHISNTTYMIQTTKSYLKPFGKLECSGITKKLHVLYKHFSHSPNITDGLYVRNTNSRLKIALMKQIFVY